jgi:hypothetical protein
MKKIRFLHDSKGKKVGVILSLAEFKRPSEAFEEMECVRAYDAANAFGGLTFPYKQVLRRIERLRK